jgi:hypothetical protein
VSVNGFGMTFLYILRNIKTLLIEIGGFLSLIALYSGPLSIDEPVNRYTVIKMQFLW